MERLAIYGLYLYGSVVITLSRVVAKRLVTAAIFVGHNKYG